MAEGVAGIGERRQRAEVIDRIRAMPGNEKLSNADLRIAYDSVRTFANLGGESIDTTLRRVEGNPDAQATLRKLVGVRQRTDPYSDPTPTGSDPGEIDVTLNKNSATYALMVTQDAIHQVGGVSEDNASAAVGPLREQVEAAQAGAKPAEPAYLSFGSDAFVDGTGTALKGLSDTLEAHPFAAYTLTAVSFVAGPVKFLVGYGAAKLTDPLVGYAAQKSYERASGVGYDPQRSQAMATGVAGIGAVLIGFGTGGVGKFQGLFGGATRALEGVAAKGMNFLRRLGGDGIPTIRLNIPFGKGIQEQGFAFENYLAGKLPEESRLPPGFKTFDFFDRETGLATSVKTLDTQTVSRLSDPRQLYASLKGNIDAISGFDKARIGRVSLNASDITSRQLQVAIPAATNANQLSQITRAIGYGTQNGVKVIVTKVR